MLFVTNRAFTQSREPAGSFSCELEPRSRSI
jgi:hypothetical protein